MPRVQSGLWIALHFNAVTDWAALSHAYGPANDVPELLAAISAGVGPDAQEALEELFTVLYHQGSTYPATEEALPYLVDLALDGPPEHRPSLTSFLGSLAREDATHPLVGRHVDRLTALLDDDLAAVREPAAWLLAEYTGREPLERRYAVETDPLVRASLLVAVVEADPSQDVSLALSALGDAEPAVRVGAAAALAWAGERLPDESVPAIAAAFDAGDPLGGWSWASDTVTELLTRLVEPAGMFAALAGSADPEVRMAVAYSIADAIDEDEADSLVPLLGPLVTDPDPSVRLAAVHAAAAAGPAAVVIADSLAASAEPITRGDGADLDDARKALHVLIEIDDSRWRPLLVAAWAQG